MQTTNILLRRTLAAALALCVLPAGGAFAQPDKDDKTSGGSWVVGTNHLGIQRIQTPGIDRDWVEIEDMKTLDEGRPLTRFAIAHRNTIVPTQHGTWDTPSADIRRWRLAIGSPDALSINLGFTRFHLPEGAELTLLDASGKAQFRSFTAADNDAHGQLWTPLVSGDEITLVLTVPAKAIDRVQLELGSINHGYRGLGETPWFAKSGSCNVDVICPEGDAWRDQIRSVAALTLGGVDQCSGALVNNVRGDLTPYFLTAYHCDFNSPANAASMVAYWNYENSVCRPPGSSSSGGPGNGSRTQFNTGAQVRAGRSASDFALVEFDDPIDPAFNLYWAGIDARDQVTSSAVAIHHPSVEEKRISFENQPTTITTYLSATVTPTGTHLRVADWDLGTTEGGSSGSPLFSPEKRIVGQLHGGYAACGNDDADWYGRVAVSWAAGGTAATQLKSWLDPDDTGTLVIDGRNMVEGPFDLTVSPTQLEVCAADVTATATIAVTEEEPGFADPVALTIAGVPSGATSTFTPTAPTPGTSSTLTLGDLDEAAAGTYPLQITGTSGTDEVTKPLSLSLVSDVPSAPVLTAPADGATGVSTTAQLAWSAVADAAGYRVLVDDDADFSSPVFDDVVADATAVSVPGLSVSTQYHWRVIAENACGEGIASEDFTFETGVAYCDVAGASIPDANAAGITHTLTVPDSANITDLQLGLDVVHSYMGDVRAVLRKVEENISVTVFDRPGVPASTYGCGGENADIVLDDAATLSAETNCVAAVPAYTPGEHYQPNNPLSAFDGIDLAGTWTLTVSDNAGGDTGTLVEWCLLPTTAPIINEPPVAGTLEDASAAAGSPFTYDAGAAFSDPNNDALSFAATGLPGWASIDPATGVITGTPTLADVGVSMISVAATEDHEDGGTATAGFTLTVYEVNLPPAVSAVPDVSAALGAPFVFDAGAYFSDPNGDTLVFSALGLPGWASLDPATGIITGTPGPGSVGEVIVTLRATEDTPEANTVSDTFRLTVVDGNVPPIATPPAPVAVGSGGTVTIDARLAFDDPNGDTLTYSSDDLPAWATLDPATGLITGVPSAADAGDHTFTVVATEVGTEDGFSASATFIVTVEVTPDEAIFADGFED